MPRIIVTTDAVASGLTGETPVLLEEHVHSVHLSTGHASAQLIERLAWAIGDAERAEGAGAEGARPDVAHAERSSPRERAATNRRRSSASRTRTRTRRAVSA
ncbi:MAG: hypothetical protein ABSG93_09395 [Solirubrobacteraceae bacterium]|jgi:hypothetical protein